MNHAQAEAWEVQQDMLIEQWQRGGQEIAVAKAQPHEFRRDGDRPTLGSPPRERGTARCVQNGRAVRLARRPPIDRGVDQVTVPVLSFEFFQRDLRDRLRRHGFYLDTYGIQPGLT